MPRTIDRVHIQRKVVESIVATLGSEHVYSIEHGKLAKALRNCKKEVAPTVSLVTLRRWWNFFLKYGTTQAEIHKKRKKTKNVTRWRQRHTETLKAIVDTNPDLYLDEIQMKMYEYRAGWWSTTTLWRKMKNELEYSLQVATDRSYSASEEEQREYQAALAARLINPDQLIFIDESQKDRNEYNNINKLFDKKRELSKDRNYNTCKTMLRNRRKGKHETETLLLSEEKAPLMPPAVVSPLPPPLLPDAPPSLE